MDSLVSSANSKHWWIVTFDETRTQLEVFLREGFPDQGLLSDTVAAIENTMPETKIQAMDLRRANMPQMESRFEAADNAIHFSGKLYLSDLEGFKFIRINRRFSCLLMVPFFKHVLKHSCVGVTQDLDGVSDTHRTSPCLQLIRNLCHATDIPSRQNLATGRHDVGRLLVPK